MCSGAVHEPLESSRRRHLGHYLESKCLLCDSTSCVSPQGLWTNVYDLSKHLRAFQYHLFTARTHAPYMALELAVFTVVFLVAFFGIIGTACVISFRAFCME